MFGTKHFKYKDTEYQYKMCDFIFVLKPRPAIILVAMPSSQVLCPAEC